MAGISGRTRAGQAILESTLVTVALIIAIAGMAIYMKRAVAGRLHAGAKAIGEPFSPRWSRYAYTTQSVQRVKNELDPTGESRTTILSDPRTGVNGSLTRVRGAVDLAPEEALYDITGADAQPYMDDFSNKKLSEEATFE